VTNELSDAIYRIFEGFKAEHCSFEKAVELLESLFQSLSPNDQPQFFEILQSCLLSEDFSHPPGVRTVHQVIIRAWARFGPADRLPSIVFALLRYDDKQRMEPWALEVAPEFIHSLYSSRHRFSTAALDVISAQCELLISEQSTELTGIRFPKGLMEVATRLANVVGKITFELFEKTLTAPRAATLPETQTLNYSIFDLKIEILRVIIQSSPRAVNKYNLLGRPPTKGELELTLGAPFSDDDRNHAYRAFDELRRSDHIRPTYADLVNPELWVVATEAGRRAVETGALDTLDEFLLKISPHLLRLRRGMWAALGRGDAHSLEQAAHSARELIDQLLKVGAPDDEIKTQSWYTPERSSATGVTRRMRLKFLTEKFAGNLSESELKVTEKATEYVVAVDDKLVALAHSRIEPRQDEVKQAVDAAEGALKSVLTSIRQPRNSTTRENP
jgi:hypothetical protein